MGTRTITPYSNNDGQIGSSSKYWDKGYFNTLYLNSLSGYLTFSNSSNISTLELLSNEDTGDKLTIATTTHGATTISTVDDDATAAHLTLDVDGDIIHDPESGKVKWQKAGNASDYLQLTIGNDGQATFATVDGNAIAADLTFDVDGDIILDAFGKQTYIAYNGTNLFEFDTNGMNFKMMALANQNDYFNIEVGSEGVTTITTVDADTTAAHLTLSADGNIILTTPDMHYSTSIKRRKMSVTSDTDFDHDGDVVYFGAVDGSVNQGDICYLDTVGAGNVATWVRAQADTENTSTSLLAISLGTDPATDGMLLRGMFTLAQNLGDNSYGDPVYLSDTSAGDADMTAPADNNEVVRVIGYKMGNDDEIWFCPDNTWVVVSA